MIILKLKFDNFIQGKGLWKHNNSLLRDNENIEIINKAINIVKIQYALPIYNIQNFDRIPQDKNNSI